MSSSLLLLPQIEAVSTSLPACAFEVVFEAALRDQPAHKYISSFPRIAMRLSDSRKELGVSGRWVLEHVINGHVLRRAALG
jgi:hypothetical protein